MSVLTQKADIHWRPGAMSRGFDDKQSDKNIVLLTKIMPLEISPHLDEIGFIIFSKSFAEVSLLRQDRDEMHD